MTQSEEELALLSEPSIGHELTAGALLLGRAATIVPYLAGGAVKA
jgi:hypothetical protein